MKSILLIIATALFGTTFAKETVQPIEEVQMNYPYVSLGLGPAPIPLPVFGAGYRLQRGHHGFDTSIEGATVWEASAVKGSVLYNYYFTPNPCRQDYIGFGPSVGVGFARYHRSKVAGAAEFTFGKQYITDTGATRFFQADIDFPVIVGNKFHTYAIPILVLKYGIGF